MAETMNRLVLFIIASLLPFAGNAQSGDTSADVPQLNDYAWGFPIETGGPASFYSVELPLEVNQSVTDPALRDVGVYNSDGKPVSRTVVELRDEGERIERSSPLPALPLFELPDNRTDRNQLSIEREDDSTQFRFDLEDLLAPDEHERLVAYIVDTRQGEDKLAAIDLAWEQMDPGFMGRIMVDGGNDLQNWRPIGSNVVAYLREDAASIEQRRIVLRTGDYEYLRIRWEGLPDDWRLSQVMGIRVEGVSDASRKFVTLESTGTDPDDGGRLFSLGGAPTVDRLRVVLPVPNTVVSSSVYYWSDAFEHWVEAGHGSYHHIIRGGNAVMSEALNIGQTRTSRFKVLVTRGPADVQLQLEVGWRPDKLLFLAQGQPPFTLAAGNADDERHEFPQHRIYGSGSIAGLAQRDGNVVAASLGPRYSLGGPERLAATREINWQTLALWLGLILGVVFVGFMAIRTIRDLRST